MRYALTVKGNVQDVGYRDYVEKSANVKRLKGYVFNDMDGTVKMVCEGAAEKIDNFIDDISLHEDYIFVEDIQKSEVDDAFPIPVKFSRVENDELT